MISSVLNNDSAHWKACVLVKRRWLIQFRNLAFGLHHLLIYVLAERLDFKSSGLDSNLNFVSNLFNPIGLMLVRIQVSKIASN